MAYFRKLGLFVEIPSLGKEKTYLVPPLTQDQAMDLSLAFLRDMSVRLAKLKKLSGSVFLAVSPLEDIKDHIPQNYVLLEQDGKTRGDRMRNAFETMLEDEGSFAVIMGSDIPDVPLKHIKRAFLKLKHKDVVLGPGSNGGYYLIGLKSPAPFLFDDIRWGTANVLEDTLEKIESHGLSLSLLPMWYQVDNADSLALLRTMMRAKILEKSGRLPETENVVARIFNEKKGA